MRSSTSSRRLRLRRTGAPSIADRRSFKLDQWRRQRPRRRRQRERRHALLDHLGDRLELGQPLDARLRLRRLARLGPEAVDETLQMRALGILLRLGRGLQPRLLGAPGFKIVVAAGVELELALAQMQDRVDGIVQKLAVVADDQGGVRVFLQARFEPQRAFEVEIVGRLVEQQQIRLARTARRRAPPACASRRKTPPSGDRDRHWRSRVRLRFPPRAPARDRHRWR